MDTIATSKQEILDALVRNKEKFDQLFLKKPNPIDTKEFDDLKDEFFTLKRLLEHIKDLPYKLNKEN